MIVVELVFSGKVEHSEKLELLERYFKENVMNTYEVGEGITLEQFKAPKTKEYTPKYRRETIDGKTVIIIQSRMNEDE